MAKETPIPRDPITERALLPQLLIASLVLALCMAWAVWDETVTRRPWKAYQAEFRPLLQRARDLAAASAENDLEKTKETPTYTEAKERFEKASAAAAEPETKKRIDTLTAMAHELSAKELGILGRIKTVRADLQAAVYTYETQIHHGDHRDPDLKARIDRLDVETRKVVAEHQANTRARNKVKAELKKLVQPLNEARAKLHSFGKKLLLAKEAAAGVDEFQIEIRQVFKLDRFMVDRCQSCHLGVLYPEIAFLKGTKSYEQPFTAHPRSELLDLHPMDTFGCTYCHGGAGPLVNDVERAHGYYHKTPWPMHPKGMEEAGCVNCHRDQIEIDDSEIFIRGKELFMRKGCWGCHKYQGFTPWEDDMAEARRKLSEVRKQRDATRKEILRRSDRAADCFDDPDLDEEEAQALSDRLLNSIPGLTLDLAGLDTTVATLDKEISDLSREVKKVAPSLLEVRKKIRPEWLEVWLLDPQHFRADTRMPNFYLDDRPEQIKAIAAFVWQRALKDDEGLKIEPIATPVTPELIAEGRGLFRDRGCLGCHRTADPLGEDEPARTEPGQPEKLTGNPFFAADLSWMGEKANRDYLASWIQRPRVHNPFTVMPNLRLSRHDSVAIATYLTSRRRRDRVYPTEVGYLEDPKLAEKGLDLVKFYGCPGCHTIRGLETQGRIGTELTFEGSKDITLFDFGHLTEDFQRQGRFTKWDWLKTKLTNPRFFDKHKIVPLLRMPNFKLQPEEVNAIATFLLGSTDKVLPPGIKDEPVGLRRDIADGWWLVKRYNCIGCHQIQQRGGTLRTMPWYEGKQALAPPILDGEGMRVQPAWLASFLREPISLRPWLKVRMPTFKLTDREVTKMARFFSAHEGQRVPYVPPPMQPLQGEVKARAQDIVVRLSCFKCHLSSKDQKFNEADAASLAPNLALARDRMKPEWVARWLWDPAGLMPGTKMPRFYDLPADAEPDEIPDYEESFREMIGGHPLQPRAAYDLIIQYLYTATDAELAETSRRTQTQSAGGAAAGPAGEAP